MRLLIKSAKVATLGQSAKLLNDYSIAVDGDRITAIGPASELRDDGSFDEVIDAGGKLAMPGFINTHMHFYSTFARGLTKAAPSRDFNEVLKNLWWRLDRALTEEDIYVSTMIPLLEGIRRGTTAFIDHHASPCAVRGSLNAIARAVRETGLRASLCYEVSDRDGAKIAGHGIEENADFIRACQANPAGKLRALFGLHASFTVSYKTLEKAVRLASSLGSGFHVHTAEAESDQYATMNQYKMRVVERFEKAGVLGPKTICAHCVHVNDHELDLLARTQTAVVHNPQSNMNNAVGTADVQKMLRKGILVGLGTDAMTVNMLEELRTGIWAQRLRQHDTASGFGELTYALFTGNRQIASRYWDCGVGELKVGYAADIVLIDYVDPTPMDSTNFLGHAVFGLAEEGVVDTTIVGGSILMKGRKLQLDIDELALRAKSRELAKRLWERF